MSSHGSAAPIPPLLLIGCGKMGSALLNGWILDGLAPSVIIDPAASAVSAPHRIVASVDALPADFVPETVVLAVKPQTADGVMGGLGARFPAALFLSIMAGRTIASMREKTGAACWVRAMPNLPASIGRGVTAAFASPEVGMSQTHAVSRLLGAVGAVTWLDDEALLDAATAVSGSGPAYVFLLAEVLEEAAMKVGLPREVARLLARRTVSGAGAMLDADEADAASMRRAVTSKAGTTERALSVLMRQDGLGALIDEAVVEAAARSRELAS